MQIVTDIKELQNKVSQIKHNHQSIGFVPTMGALHKGHVSLIMKAQENDCVIASIFVNPKQFGEGEDFEKYPRMIEADIDICKKAGVHILFMPKAEQLYTQDDAITILAPSIKGSILEGARRVGHFNGVLEVLLRLFHIAQPNKAYFGKKDAQQLLIVKQMVEELFLPVEIVSCPIVRDSNGLALSSRNRYLTQEGYHKALIIPKTLEEISKQIMGGEYRSAILQQKALEIFSTHNIEVDYIAITNYNLEEIKEIKKSQSLILLVVRIESVRLLDNLWI